MIKQIVKTLIETHESSDPLRICKDLDILIIYYPLIGVNGFYQYYMDQDIIYLNDRLNDQERILVLAHELGHCILHKDVNALYLEAYNQVTTRYEIQANAFAILLLKDRLNLNMEIPLLDWRSDNNRLKELVL